ncbi:peroxisomal biogenesis factor 5 like [Rhinolophus ferrumequinum]|uniref:PEX5-related protein n=3 Tax=Rhinolophus ferrumequinum TaxID=59479 RepID=A0A7J8AG27_RHIFE|nr:PEX5-related protein isoform X1 [Rhinolophus ferrumequinum]XP_032945238.1 PEX5-related protein isoform X1 [Rhinolophus ferrumequinum]KAF6385298.1 peroxisomal biogenesis factor 5 like [Rhinolophus ferrumequinum]
MSDSKMDGRTHIPSLLNVLMSRNRVMQMSYLKSKEKGYGKLSSDEDLEIIVDQKQGKGSRAADKAVAMVMKEIPREESAEEKPLLTMTSQLVNEQQESRPLLSPSIDDFLCETKSEAIARPVTSNTAVLTTGLDLLDLSEPISQTPTKGKKLEASSKTSSLKKKADGSDLIGGDAEQRGPPLRGPETSSLDLDIQTQLEKWEDVKFRDRASKGHPMAERKSCSSRTGSKELLWSSEHRSQPELSGGKSALNSESASELELVPPAQARLTKEQRWGSALLSRNHSLEEEFERAKAAVESDTEFWDKMQAEWEEMARRNWISENQEAQNQVTISASEKGYYFHTENPFKDWPGAFEEGLKRLKEGDLPVTILFMEAAILQDPGDAEAWQFLGITQAENENEQAAIVALQRCLDLQPNNLKALMALAVSYTNTGHQQDACESLKNWIKQNPKYKYLVKSKKGSPGLTRRMSKSPVDSAVLEGVKELYLEAAHQNGDVIDPDLQTGLGVLFHLSGEFNRAIDAFNAALTVRPEDYSLWNRLGATLANGDRSEEAVEAYTRALEIQPGFIRSRYNLGISCINLGAYREAVSNFLTALSLQRKSRNQQQVPHPAISGNIWAALRIALSLMDQPELFQAANLGDLDVLLRAFNLDP